MKQLNAVITHLPADEAERDLRVLRELAPDSQFLCCYTGQRAWFERLEGDAIPLEDDWLGGPPRTYQSYHGVFAALAERSFDALYLIEYDHLVLAPGSRTPDRSRERTGADFMGKNCSPATALIGPTTCAFAVIPPSSSSSAGSRPLPDGSIRDAGQRDVALSRCARLLPLARCPSRCYGELYVPTVLHHLGHRLVDLDAVSDLYGHVRWQPEKTTSRRSSALER